MLLQLLQLLLWVMMLLLWVMMLLLLWVMMLELLLMVLWRLGLGYESGWGGADGKMLLLLLAG